MEELLKNGVVHGSGLMDLSTMGGLHRKMITLGGLMSLRGFLSSVMGDNTRLIMKLECNNF